jgi:hypothetical protein
VLEIDIFWLKAFVGLCIVDFACEGDFEGDPDIDFPDVDRPTLPELEDRSVSLAGLVGFVMGLLADFAGDALSAVLTVEGVASSVLSSKPSSITELAGFEFKDNLVSSFAIISALTAVET